MSIENKINNYGNLVENHLNQVLSDADPAYKIVVEAMRYSALMGGKRIRPVLLLEFNRICGGTAEQAINFACALEMIHTYSLIHDDLPCMDNDDIRRGNPSCHVKFGEDMALLAGDGLLTKAFEISADTTDVKPQLVITAIKILASYAGAEGMIGGQVIDLQSENQQIGFETLMMMYSMKTGALIKAAAEIGCVLAGADQEKVDAAVKYCECIGLAFQIVDDILDKTGEASLLGKPIGSDEANLKSTYVSMVGLETATKKVKELTASAKKVLKVFDSDVTDLLDLADFLSDRKF